MGWHWSRNSPKQGHQQINAKETSGLGRTNSTTSIFALSRIYAARDGQTFIIRRCLHHPAFVDVSHNPLWARWWPTARPGWCFGGRSIWHRVSAVSLSSCSKCHRLANPLLLPADHILCRPPQEGGVGCRTVPGQETRRKTEAPCLQTRQTWLLYPAGCWNFSQGWWLTEEGEVSESSGRELQKTIISPHSGHESHTFCSWSWITLVSLGPSTGAEIYALLTNMVTCRALFALSVWIIALFSTFFFW